VYVWGLNYNRSLGVKDKEGRSRRKVRTAIT